MTRLFLALQLLSKLFILVSRVKITLSLNDDLDLIGHWGTDTLVDLNDQKHNFIQNIIQSYLA